MQHSRSHAIDPLAFASASGGEVVALVSGKGGVGKSNLALNLGLLAARQQRRVILLDADLGLANTDILLNVTAIDGVADALTQRRPLEELLIAHSSGLRILCGYSASEPLGQLPSASDACCAQLVRRLRGLCELLLIDCGAGLGAPVVEFATTAERLLLVITPEPTALADGYALLKHLTRTEFAGEMCVAVNMAQSAREADGVADRLRRAARDFLGRDVTYLGAIPFDPHLVRAVRARAPVTLRYPRCAASNGIQRLYDHIVPQLPASGRSAGLWNRVAGLFL